MLQSEEKISQNKKYNYGLQRGGGLLSPGGSDPAPRRHDDNVLALRCPLGCTTQIPSCGVGQGGGQQGSRVQTSLLQLPGVLAANGHS